MKVIIALDTTDFGEFIVESLAAAQWPQDTSFILASVIDERTGRFSPTESLNSRESQQTRLETRILIHDLAKKLKRLLPSHEIFSEILTGAPGEQIVQLATKLHADLIVVGHHGTSTSGQEHLGATADYIVQQAHCTVEVLKAKDKLATAKR